MKKTTPYLITTAFLAISVFQACKREASCEGCIVNNKPPIAAAGPDMVITLLTDSVLLDGNGSSDPDGNISAWQWTKISGPASFNIAQPSAATTVVKNLVTGAYQFELKVTDADGLFSKDTVQVTVNAAIAIACDNSNRSVVNAQLIPIGIPSQARTWMGVASADNKIVFAGGHTYGNLTPSYPSSKVDIYDFTTKSWSTAELSLARAEISAVAVGNKIFFAGGVYYDSSDPMWDNPPDVSVMDIYDVVSNTWSVVPLIGDRTYTASAAAGNKVFFAYGSKVDIYDISAQTWSTKSLSDGRYDKIFFAGGYIMQGGAVIPKNTIDIYDNATNTWSVSSLAEGRKGVAGITAAGKVYFAGGYNSNTNNPPFTTSCIVDIVDANTENKSVQYLSRQWQHPGQLAVIKNRKIALLNISWNNPEFDIYDITTNTWSIGVLPLQNTIFGGRPLFQSRIRSTSQALIESLINPTKSISWSFDF